MKYFGTDGIRGKVDEKINKHLIKKVAKALVLYYKRHNLNRFIIIGNDGRNSGEYILFELCSTLLRYGFQIDNIGFCSSPCLAYLTKKFNYPLGIMISASHNTFEYNGFKFFNSLGEKCDDNFESEFEVLLDKKLRTSKTKFGNIKNSERLKSYYVNFLKSLLKSDIECIFDCANGGTSFFCKQVFKKSKKINANPNLININKNSGCLYLHTLKKEAISKNKIGIAFDGDGDRITLIDSDGNIIDGDMILFILAKFFLNYNESIVGTTTTNSGLENSLNKRSQTLIRTQVGDKYITKYLKEHNLTLGGESCGHIIVKKYSNTGDGILVAILLLNILSLSKNTLQELLADYQQYHQASFDYPNQKISVSKIQEFAKKYENQARIVVRPSGTEPKIRLLVECKDKNTAHEILEQLKFDISMHIC